MFIKIYDTVVQVLKADDKMRKRLDAISTRNKYDANAETVLHHFLIHDLAIPKRPC